MTRGKAAHTTITLERRAKFLEVLAKTGSPVEAARCATPHGRARQPGYTCFLRLRKTDPEFARDWDDARAQALALIESEIHRRAFDVPKRPVYDNGVVVGWVEDRRSADTLLLRLAERMDPEWAQRKQHELQGRIEHAHLVEHQHVFHLTPEAILLLPSERRELLITLLGEMHDRMADNREVIEHGYRPALSA